MRNESKEFFDLYPKIIEKANNGYPLNTYEARYVAGRYDNSSVLMAFARTAKVTDLFLLMDEVDAYVTDKDAHEALMDYLARAWASLHPESID